MFTFFGFIFGRASSVKNFIDQEIDTARHKERSETKDRCIKMAQQGLSSLRDLVHNLPFHLNFETDEEAYFCHDVLSQSYDLIDFDYNTDFHRFPISKELELKLTGLVPFMSGDPLNSKHFENARKGHLCDALYITKVIFCKNRPRYQRCTEWFDDIPGFLSSISGQSREEVIESLQTINSEVQ